MDSNLFKEVYNRLLEQAKTEYIRESNDKLPWVFRDESERDSERMSSREKAAEYSKRIEQWQAGRNPVQASEPSFA